MPLLPLVCHSWMVLLPLFRHPGNLQAGVQKHLKIKRKSKSMDSRLKISGMTDEGECLIKNLRVVTPERLYCPFFVTPAIFKPGSMVLKTKEKAKTWIPNKRFWEWRMMLDSLNASIIPKSLIPECLYEGSKQWEGTSLSFPIEGQKEKAKTWIPNKRF